MSLKLYLLLLLAVTLVCWGLFAFILFSVDPEGGKLPVIAFYAVLGFAAMGTFALAGYAIRSKMSRGEELYANLGISLRQGLLLSIGLLGVLLLQSIRLLNWWDGCLLVGFLVLLEFFFLSRK